MKLETDKYITFPTVYTRNQIEWISIFKSPVHIENDGRNTECKQNFFLSILVYLLFNKKSDKKIFKKKHFFDWKTSRSRDKEGNLPLY